MEYPPWWTWIKRLHLLIKNIREELHPKFSLSNCGENLKMKRWIALDVPTDPITWTDISKTFWSIGTKWMPIIANTIMQLSNARFLDRHLNFHESRYNSSKYCQQLPAILPWIIASNILALPLNGIMILKQIKQHCYESIISDRLNVANCSMNTKISFRKNSWNKNNHGIAVIEYALHFFLVFIIFINVSAITTFRWISWNSSTRLRLKIYL